MKTPAVRTILFFVMLTLVLTLPWWLSAVALFVLVVYYPLYLEAIFFGFLFDTLYSSHHNLFYPGLLAATLALLIVVFVRTQVRR